MAGVQPLGNGLFRLEVIQMLIVAWLVAQSGEASASVSPSPPGMSLFADQYLGLRICITAIVAALLLLHWLNPKVQFDMSSLVLVALASLPWLAPLIVSFKVGEFEATFRDLNNAVQQNKQQIAKVTTDLQTDALQPSGQPIISSVPPIPTPTPNTSPSTLQPSATPAPNGSPASVVPSPTPTTRASPSAQSEMDQLAQEYDRLRTQEASSFARTAKMTKTAWRMVHLAPQLGRTQVATYLSSNKASDRLKAACILYALPDPNFLDDLISALEGELSSKWGQSPQPFLEYWQILAIGKIVDAIISLGQPVSDEVVTRLKRILAAMNDPYDKSRYNALDEIITRLPHSNA